MFGNLKIEWKAKTGKYETGDNAFVGKILIGSIGYDGARPRGSVEMFAASFRLPGIKGSLGHFKDDKAAKEKVEFAFRHWLKMLTDD